MIVREATLEDVGAMHALRVSVRENRLSDPLRITEADYLPFLAQPRASWVAESESRSGSESISLVTEPGTRAEQLYLAAGWTRVGIEPTGEIRFGRGTPDAVYRLALKPSCQTGLTADGPSVG